MAADTAGVATRGAADSPRIRGARRWRPAPRDARDEPSRLDPCRPSTDPRPPPRPVAIVSMIAPALASRAAALLRELERSAPLVDGVVSSHGDFHGGQLLVQSKGWPSSTSIYSVLPRQRSTFATYAGHLVPKEAPDIDAAATALDELVEGYGARPPWLAWYLSISILRRARVPFLLRSRLARRRRNDARRSRGRAQAVTDRDRTAAHAEAASSRPFSCSGGKRVGGARVPLGRRSTSSVAGLSSLRRQRAGSRAS